jgi:hypothetical protein
MWVRRIIGNSSLSITEIAHPSDCGAVTGSTGNGGTPSKLLVSKPQLEGGPPHALTRRGRGGARLHERGWSIAAIARHVGRDRKTVAYLNGEREADRTPLDHRPIRWHRSCRTCGLVPPITGTSGPARCSMRSLGSASTAARWPLLAGCGCAAGAPTCEACAGVGGRATIEIEHPPGEEIPWDWYERRRAP